MYLRTVTYITVNNDNSDKSVVHWMKSTNLYTVKFSVIVVNYRVFFLSISRHLSGRSIILLSFIDDNFIIRI